MTTNPFHFQIPEQIEGSDIPRKYSNPSLINFDVIKKLTIIGTTFGKMGSNYKIKKQKNEFPVIKKPLTKQREQRINPRNNINEIENIFDQIQKTFLLLKEKKQKSITNNNNTNNHSLTINKNEHNDYFNSVWNYLGNSKPPFHKNIFDFESKQNNIDSYLQSSQYQPKLHFNSNKQNLKDDYNNNDVIESNEKIKQSIIYRNNRESYPISFLNHQDTVENMQFVNNVEYKHEPKQREQIIYNNINRNCRIIPHFDQNKICNYYNSYSQNNLSNVYFPLKHSIKIKINSSSSLLGKKIERFNDSSDKGILTNKLLYKEFHS